MKRYFVVNDGASETYETKQAMLKDLHTFMDSDGKGEVVMYRLNETKDVTELTSEDEIGRYENGAIVYLKGKRYGY